MSKHTPGPWKACRSHETFHGPMWDIEPDELADYEYSPFVSIKAKSDTVMFAHDLFEMTPADARLIAAAPELLEAAVRARDIAMEYAVKARIPECGKFSEIAQELDAAIAKATTGETP